MEDGSGTDGAEQEGWNAFGAERFSEKEYHRECEQRGEKYCGAACVTESQGEGHCPDAKRDGESSPTGCEQCSTEEDGSQWLEVWQSVREITSEHAEGNQKADNKDDWQIAFHVGGRIVDFLGRG